MTLTQYLNRPSCPEGATWEQKLAHVETRRCKAGEVGLNRNEVQLSFPLGVEHPNSLVVTVRHYNTSYKVFRGCAILHTIPNLNESCFSLSFNPFTND